MAYVPADDELVETVTRGAVLTPQNRPSIEHARDWLALSARTGDARLAARAEVELRALPPSDDVDLSLAWAAQHRHDFAGAIVLLDRIVARNPRAVGARAMRVQIDLVQGRILQARAGCAQLALLDRDSALGCAAAIAQRSGNGEAARRALDALAGSDTPAAAENERAQLVLRAEAAPDATAARNDFERALQLAPDDVRTRAAFARYLRNAGQPAEALSLVVDENVSDALRLERVLSARAAGDARWSNWADELEATYAAMRAIGATPELRDEAAFRLYVRGDAPGALALASQNWNEQRDVEDEAILLAAARAAGDENAMSMVAQWRESQGLATAGTPAVDAVVIGAMPGSGTLSSSNLADATASRAIAHAGRTQ